MSIINTDMVVVDIQQMFKNINEGTLNYWGVADRDQFAPLACLHCSKCMYDFNEFAEYGPTYGRQLWFCGEDATEFYKRISLLKYTAWSEGKNFDELFERALEPLRKMEKEMENSSETRTARATGKRWVFFG